MKKAYFNNKNLLTLVFFRQVNNQWKKKNRLYKFQILKGQAIKIISINNKTKVSFRANQKN